MKTYLPLIAVAAVAALIAPAAAQEFNGSQEIARGDYAAARQVIEQQRKLFAADPDLLINLAAVYRRDGRVAEARGLYRQVLQRPDEQLDLGPRRAAWSHDLASAALRDLDRTTLSKR